MARGCERGRGKHTSSSSTTRGTRGKLVIFRSVPKQQYYRRPSREELQFPIVSPPDSFNKQAARFFSFFLSLPSFSVASVFVFFLTALFLSSLHIHFSHRLLHLHLLHLSFLNLPFTLSVLLVTFILTVPRRQETLSFHIIEEQSLLCQQP